jgi:organic hydroperoxide reductase OsmC/OhrA
MAPIFATLGTYREIIMSQHSVQLHWQNTAADFTYETYSRTHQLSFDNGKVISASSAPAYFGDESAVDPEEMLVAALSSCHMLTFLAVASKRAYVVVSYEDNAIGHLEKNASGKMAITRVQLSPKIVFSSIKQPNAAELEALHHKAHENCFIANSVSCEVTVKA